MKKYIATLLTAAASVAFATGTETAILLDVARRNTSISLSYTECCDHAVRATIRDSGDDFDCNGWTVNMVFGAGDRGVVHEGVVTNANEVLFDIPASSMPTNGKYTVQVLAMKSGRSYEWGRGTLRVNANPGMEYMPTCWMGYQKVARLAASMITVELLTNDVVQAAMSNSVARLDVTNRPMFTNVCFFIDKTFVPGLNRATRFFWDRQEAEPWVFRTARFPEGVFYAPGGSITNAFFELTRNGETTTYTNNASGMFLPASTNVTDKFHAHVWWDTDAKWAEAIQE